MNSELKKLFSIRKRNWDTIFKEATSSLVVRVAEIYNNGMTSPTQIGKELGIHRKTVRSYLEKAVQLEMINYEKRVTPVYSINVYDVFDALLFEGIGLKGCVRNLENLSLNTHLGTIKNIVIPGFHTKVIIFIRGTKTLITKSLISLKLMICKL